MQAGDSPTNRHVWTELGLCLMVVIWGANFTVVRALIARGGARAFERWTGEWPGD